MTITLVRHGQTDWNSNNKMQGLSNIGLNDCGISACQRLRQKLSDKHFDVCYTSPLLRAVETAFILIGDRTEIIPDKRLIERDIGEFEGKSRDLYDARKYWDYQLNSNDLGVERVQDVFRREEDFLSYLKSKYDDSSNILIVSHGSPIRVLHHLLHNTRKSDNLLDIKVDNCYLETIEIKG